MPHPPLAPRPLANRLAPRLVSHHDLCTTAPLSDPGPLLASLSGDFAPPMAALFPDAWAWAALATPLPTRQIWYAVLSGLPATPPNPEALRSNLLHLNPKLLLRLRFDGLSEPMHGILTRLTPTPLPRPIYTNLAKALAKDPALIAFFAGQTGPLNTSDVTAAFED